MMLPGLKPLRRRVTTVDRWEGLRRIEPPLNGTFEQEENLCSDLYPALSPRPPRRLADTGVNGLCAGSGLYTVKAQGLYRNGVLVCSLTAGKKQLVRMGGRLLIWPDKVMYDPATDMTRELGAVFTTTGSVTVTQCTLNGTAITPTVAATAPKSPEAGDYWLDTGGDEDVLKLWDENESRWQSVPTAYVKLAATGIGRHFARYDTVRILNLTGDAAGLGGSENDVSSVSPDKLLYDANSDSLIIAGVLRKSAVSAGVTVRREIPDLDFVTECDNRVWGCSSARNEIFCCKLGDPTNWYRYMGTADDSYAVTVGSSGPFTGAVTHLGYVLFFKEECIHKVYGSVPAKYQIFTTRCRGVQAGCAESLALVNETLYYRSRDGVCAYDGSLPQKISGPLGEDVCVSAAAGSWGELYYLALRRPDVTGELLVYDTANGVWNREDALCPLQFVRQDGKLYACTEDGTLWVLRGGEADEGPVKWSARTGPLGTAVPDAKYVDRLQLRLRLPAGSRLAVRICYDGESHRQTLADLRATREQSLSLPLRVRRCDRFRLELEGEGPAAVFALAIASETGAEVRF